MVGSYGVGLTMRIDRIPVAGETLAGGVFSSGHGGKGSNQAVGAARLNAEVSFLTAIGDDAMGRDAHALWKEEGVDAAKVLTIPGVATMVGVILVEPSGENRIVIATGALDHLTPDHVESFRPELSAADIAVVSMEIPLPTVLAALRVAQEERTRTLLNPAPAQPLPAEAWRTIDVLTPNRTEAAILLGHDPAAPDSSGRLAQNLHAHGVGTTVITLGSEGTLICDDDGLRSVPAVPAPAVVDTTGAGDAFTAALSVALAEGMRTDEAVRFAAAAGAHAVSIAEVIPSLARRSDIERLLS